MFKRSLAVILSLIMLLGLVSMSGAEGKTEDPTNVYGGLVALDDANDPITVHRSIRPPSNQPRRMATSSALCNDDVAALPDPDL